MLRRSFGSLRHSFGSLCRSLGSLCHSFGSLRHFFASLRRPFCRDRSVTDPEASILWNGFKSFPAKNVFVLANDKSKDVPCLYKKYIFHSELDLHPLICLLAYPITPQILSFCPFFIKFSLFASFCSLSN